MATGRVLNALLEGDPPTTTGRILEVLLDSDPIPLGQGRIIEVLFESEPAFTVAPFPIYTIVDPGSEVTLTASVSAGPAATDWSFTQTDGAEVTLTGTGATRTFIAPSSPDGTEVEFEVKAINGEDESIPQTVTIPVYPQTTWFWDGEAYQPMIILQP